MGGRAAASGGSLPCPAARPGWVPCCPPASGLPGDTVASTVTAVAGVASTRARGSAERGCSGNH